LPAHLSLCLQVLTPWTRWPPREGDVVRVWHICLHFGYRMTTRSKLLSSR
jgi:hypothetical protein